MHFRFLAPLITFFFVAQPSADMRAAWEEHINPVYSMPVSAGAALNFAHPPPRAMATGPSPRGRKPEETLAKGVFLIASENLSDPNFSQTVVLLLEYDESGAIGLIINRPTGVSLAALLSQVEDLKDRDELVFLGGPVGRTQLFLLVRSASRPPHSEEIVDGVYASTSLQTLREVIAEESAAAAFQAYAGYAGWAPGQLDAELLRGDWLVAPADSETVFDKASESIWPELIRQNRGLWVYRRTDPPVLLPPPSAVRRAATISEPNALSDFELNVSGNAPFSGL